MKRRILVAVLLSALVSLGASAQQRTVAVSSAPPPSAPARRSAAELEKLVAPIALYADSLLATVLPASAYPLEIVQAARFVANTNNLVHLDAQPWDDNVKAVARIPELIKKMNDDLPWTIALGETFLAQEKELFDTVQRLRAKAQEAGTLRTTPQQTVVITNIVVEQTIQERVIIVTNTVVQIQPVNPEVVYVPTYNPAYVYYPPPSYVYNPYAPLVTFGVGIAVGAIIANNCDWHHGGVYVGHHGTVAWSSGSYHHGDVDVDVNRNVNNNVNRNGGNQGNRPPAGDRPATRPSPPQKWQPDQNRLRTSSTLGASGTARTLESRGWSSGSGGARPSTLPSTGAGTTRPSTGNVAARPSTGNVATRPSTGNVATRPTTGNVTTRPTTSPSTTRSSSSYSGGQSSRPSSTSSRSSAFGGVSSGSGSRSYSSRGSSSRSSGGYSGSRGGGSRGGGGRGGGGRGR